MTKREILKETELFVLDMDGTFYLDTDVIDGALDFLEEVKKAGKRYVCQYMFSVILMNYL